MKIVEFINENILWGTPMLILFCFIGFYFTVKLKALQIIKFPYILKKTLFSRCGDNSCENRISPFSTLMTALGTTLGTGNIIAVGTAIAMGGAGAVFWMWVSGIIGMAICYAENYLGIYFRNRFVGKESQSPFSYIRIAFKNGKFSIIIVKFYAVFCILASFGMGNMAQINSASTALLDGAGIPLWATGIAATIYVLYMTLGGLKRISKVSAWLIPIVSFSYIIVSLIIIVINYSNIIPCFVKIITEAFSVKAINGGVTGIVLLEGMKWGVKRGVFSSEAGLGTSVLIHSNSTEKDPHKQGLWAMLQVFIDTIVMCSMTAICILTTESISITGNGNDLPYIAFSSLLGKYSALFLGICLFLFSCATLCGWYLYGKKCIEYLFNEKFSKVYLILFTALTFVGAVTKTTIVWEFSDMFNGMLAAINLTALIFLRKKIK